MTLKNVSPANVNKVVLIGTDGTPYNAGGTGGGPVTVADGADVAQGAVADAAYTSGSGTVVSLLKGLYTKLGAVVLAAGSAIIGKVGIDQTTNGTTNAVALTGYTANNITTATTTVVKSGAGVLHGININSKGTVASAVTVYDNTAASGTKLATLDSLNLAGWNQFDVNFATGLTIVTTGTLAPDITASYR